MLAILWESVGARGSVVWTIGNGTPAVAAIMEEIPQLAIALNGWQPLSFSTFFERMAAAQWRARESLNCSDPSLA